jgi:hypothetical protein
MLNLSLIAEPLVKMVSTMTAAIPHLLKAALILLFAWVVAILLRLLFKKRGNDVSFRTQASKMENDK